MEIYSNSLDVLIYVDFNELLTDLGPISGPVLYRKSTDYYTETSQWSEETLNDTFRKIKRENKLVDNKLVNNNPY